MHRTACLRTTCMHGRIMPVSGITGRPSTTFTPLHTARAIPGSDSSVDDLVDILKDAFGSHSVSQNGTGQPGHASSSKASASNFANPSRRSSSTGPGTASHTNASSSGRKPQKAGSSRSGVQAPVSSDAGTAAAAAKKRKGPFADLMVSLEQEMLQPPEARSSSRNNGGGNSNGNSKDEPKIASSSPTAAAAAGSTSSSPRPRVRRIRTISAADQATLAPQTQQLHQQQAQQHQHQKQQPSQQQPSQQQPSQQQPPWMLQEAAAAGSSRRKQYKPVYKGDLALPGGPAWSALRRHIAAAGDSPELPTLDCIVLVEGDQDQRAVARAVNAPVYVCDGTRVLKEHVQQELQMLTQLGRPLVVLTDPDERGRELRLHLEDTIGPLAHAFVPEPDAAAVVDGLVHAIGNRGIEHVVPVGVQQALARARSSYPSSRQVWNTQRLQEMKLANAFDAAGGVSRGPDGAAARRRQLCAMLGLGRCSAAQLVTMLNRFFDEEDVAAAVVQLEAAAEQQ